jgi:hypothetical protein
MKKVIERFLVILFCYGFCTLLRGQETIPATGGNGSGSGGTVSYTIGQVTYNTFSGTNGSVAQGVQQPYEISVVTAVENTEGITLEYIVYPNPTSGLIKLILKPFDCENWRFRLYDLNSIILQDKKIENEEIEISLKNLSASTYFLKILNNNREVKVFKIVKR